MARVISFSSGKGGVGKTVMLTNIACILANQGKKVLVIDADLSLANVDIMYGIKPEKNIQHCLIDNLPIKDVIVPGPAGIHVVAAASGSEELTLLSPGQRLMLIQFVEELISEYDYVFLDNGAGIGDNVLFIASASHMLIVVVNPEPTSFVDAYALIKLLSTKYGVRDIHVLMNRIPSGTSGQQVFFTLQDIASDYVPAHLHYLGHIEADPNVGRAVRQQKPFVLEYPKTEATQRLSELALTIQQTNVQSARGSMQFARS